jgi:transcriptional regulator with XRE-family HTH domain
VGGQYGARLSYNLSAARVRAGLTVEQVAAASGVAEYERIERGDVSPTLQALSDVADALGVGVLDLLDGVEIVSVAPGPRVKPPGWAVRVPRRSSHRRS